MNAKSLILSAFVALFTLSSSFAAPEQPLSECFDRQSEENRANFYGVFNAFADERVSSSEVEALKKALSDSRYTFISRSDDFGWGILIEAVPSEYSDRSDVYSINDFLSVSREEEVVAYMESLRQSFPSIHFNCSGIARPAPAGGMGSRVIQ